MLGHIQTHSNPHREMLCRTWFIKNCAHNGDRDGGACLSDFEVHLPDCDPLVEEKVNET